MWAASSFFGWINGNSGGRRLGGGGARERWRQAVRVGHLHVLPIKEKSGLSWARHGGWGRVSGDSTDLQSADLVESQLGHFLAE